MGALATTLGMVQYALAAKAKPYAHGGQLDGGVAQGPRHPQGGIKVLGGRAEIEGGEFITNRRSTASNIDLLEFINSKKAKVDLGDLLEFDHGRNPPIIQKHYSRFVVKMHEQSVKVGELHEKRPQFAALTEGNSIFTKVSGHLQPIPHRRYPIHYLP